MIINILIRIHVSNLKLDDDTLLNSFTADASRKLHVLRGDGDCFTVNASQIHVFE